LRLISITRSGIFLGFLPATYFTPRVAALLRSVSRMRRDILLAYFLVREARTLYLCDVFSVVMRLYRDWLKLHVVVNVWDGWK